MREERLSWSSGNRSAAAKNKDRICLFGSTRTARAFLAALGGGSRHARPPFELLIPFRR
jgi:hypothetical protein